MLNQLITRPIIEEQIRSIKSRHIVLNTLIAEG